MKTASMRLIVWLPLLALATGCDSLPGKPNPKDKFVYPNKETDFGVLYAKNCAGCHGAKGRLGPAPPLNDGVFLRIVPDDVLMKVIAEGREGTSMPAFSEKHGGTLTEAQVRMLAAGIRSHWEVPELQNQFPPYVAAGKGDAKKGIAIFEKSCKGCHGDEGKGTAKAGAINDPAFLNLASDQVLRRFVITGRPDLGMPNCLEGDGRRLDWADVDDVTALLISWKTK